MNNLEQQIWDCTKCRFNEKRDARYCGGVGDDYRAMFIAESPSTAGGTGKKPAREGFYWGPNHSKNDKLFRDIRAKYGLENCYTTDLVKCGIKAGKPTRVKIRKCLPYLLKEIDIVKPKVIVTVGLNICVECKSYNFAKLLSELINIKMPIIQTWHYSYVWNRCQVKSKNRSVPNVPEIKPEKMSTYARQHEAILAYL